ncbi:uncharacterized protein LOC107039885 [Diachasma alloeum]|uniref:uncharacterized protein LOC107039885 n=1 Tax=Diachasma alloeum TaxID=454923 RepID=UPI0007382125|nr:uncharacterized protein LOC107039885 [Diachasma alloeum]
MWKKGIVLFVILGVYQASGMIEKILSTAKPIWKYLGNGGISFEELDLAVQQLKDYDEIAFAGTRGPQRPEFSMEEENQMDRYELQYRKAMSGVKIDHEDLSESMKDWQMHKKESAVTDITGNIAKMCDVLIEQFGSQGILKLMSHQDIHFLQPNKTGIQENMLYYFESMMISEIKVLHVLSQVFKPYEWHRRMKHAVNRFEKYYLTYITTLFSALDNTSQIVRFNDASSSRRFKDFRERDDSPVAYYEIGAFKQPYVYLEPKMFINMVSRRFCTTGTFGTTESCPRLKNEENWCLEMKESSKLCVEDDRVTKLSMSPDIAYGEMKSCSIDDQLYFSDHPKSNTSVSRCFCKCHRNSSTHSISLSMSRANVVNNMIITGARFVQHNKILHIQVKQGKLMKDGKVNPKTESWVQLPHNPEVRAITIDSRTFLLNNPVLPFGYALIGAQFFMKRDKIAIRIVGKQFDMSQGILLPGLIQVSTEPFHRFETLTFTKEKPGLDAEGLNVLYTSDSGPNSHTIQLETLPIEKDFLQSTVPFFDAVAVETKPPRALSGLGLLHKGVQNISGLISLEVRLLPFRRYLAQLIMDYRPGNLLSGWISSSSRLQYILDVGRRISTLMTELSELAYGDHLKLSLRMKAGFDGIIQNVNNINYNMDVANLVAMGQDSTAVSLREKLKRWMAGAKPILETIDESYEWVFSTNVAVNFTFAKLLLPKLEKTFDDFEIFLNSSLSLTTPGQEDNFINTFFKLNSLAADTQCKGGQTMHPLLTQLFQVTIGYEVKAMIALVHIFEIKSPIRPSWKKDLLAAQQKFQVRFTNYVKLFSDVVNNFPSHIQSCDPITAEATGGKIHIESKGIGEPSYFYHKAKISDCEEAIEKNRMKWHYSKDKCSGNINSCISVTEVTICRSKNNHTVDAWTDRNGGRMNLGNCTETRGIWEYYSADYDEDDDDETIVNDKYCVCSCNKEPSIYISLNFNFANVSNNMVITGVQFVLQNKILHIKIKQGRLMPNGWVDPSSNHWVDPPQKPEKVRISAVQRRFFLKDVIFPSDYAVTGIGFYDDNGFGIKVEGQKFNFWTGTLLDDSIVMRETITHDEDDNSLKRLFKPTKSPSWLDLHTSPIENSGHNKSQLVRPRFNGLTVEVNPPTPLGGIGLFHQGSDGGNGFLALRLHSLDFKEDLKHFIKQSNKGYSFLEGL